MTRVRLARPSAVSGPVSCKPRWLDSWLRRQQSWHQPPPPRTRAREGRGWWQSGAPASRARRGRHRSRGTLPNDSGLDSGFDGSCLPAIRIPAHDEHRCDERKREKLPDPKGLAQAGLPGPVVENHDPRHRRRQHQGDQGCAHQGCLAIDHHPLGLRVDSLSLPLGRTPTPTVSAKPSSASSSTDSLRL